MPVTFSNTDIIVIGLEMAKYQWPVVSLYFHSSLIIISILREIEMGEKARKNDFP